MIRWKISELVSLKVAYKKCSTPDRENLLVPQWNLNTGLTMNFSRTIVENEIHTEMVIR